MKQFECKEIYPDCDFKTSGQDEDEVLNKALQHGKEAHGIEKLDETMKDKVRSLIRDQKEAA